MDTTLSPKRAGVFEAALQKIFTRGARVLEIAEPSPDFRLITLGGDALRDVDWTPGDKIQLMLGGWTQRTYTPLDWDAAEGRTRILVYLHGDAPGTRWARTLRQGDACAFFGPRKSVRLAPAASPVILFGDETSLGLAVALSAEATTHMLFAARDPGQTRAVAERLQLRNASVESAEHALDAHMAALLAAHPMADVVLTGKAGAIQHMGRLLREHGVGAARRQSKAYWAPGKTGLD
ncbi:NADPH-dependent ferric siderophore reductase [Duganella sp. SG902]|uniref:siderophore-interacting protein n=1 Tax=Duganella sp. SG902 TaxID=2587016 RepID=UPI00159D022B|nr:siderophore-interacting protein [Duganella sp. SG902]NVM75922.1 NADPH-dependent ferric siderophore reductase [Duganella sp. SG902]